MEGLHTTLHQYIEIDVDWKKVEVPKNWYNKDGTLNTKKINEYVKNSVLSSYHNSLKRQRHVILERTD